MISIFLPNRSLRYLIFFGIFWYILLCTVNFLQQRPLWLDEAMILKNVETLSFTQMFSEKLVASQVFPRGYLFLIQKISHPFNFHLLALRLLPFTAMLVAFFLWLKIAKRVFNDKVQYLTFVLSWTASSLLIYYSGELKQYSMDVLVGAVFILFLYNQERLSRKTDERSTLCLLALLPALCLFSYMAYVFVLFPLYNLFMFSRKNREHWRSFLVYGASLLAFVCISYFFDVRIPHPDVKQGYGDYFISFVSIGEFFKTFGEGTMNLFSRWLVERPRVIKKIGIFFMTWGLMYLWGSFLKNIKKEKAYIYSLNILPFLLFCELFLLGALKKYPFVVPRTALFFCPIVLYVTIQGIVMTKYIHRYLYRAIHGAYIIFLVFLTIALSRVVFVGQLNNQPVIF